MHGLLAAPEPKALAAQWRIHSKTGIAMQQFLVDAARLITSDYASFALTLISAGVAIILVNILSHRLIEAYKQKSERRQTVTRHLRPVLKAAADLVSRLSDILITHQEANLKIFNNPQFHDTASNPRTLRPSGITRHESTAFRLINFLLVAEYFRRKTADTPSFDLLERSEYYLQHKIAVALRGNLYGCPLLATEVQEEMAAGILRSFGDKPAADFSIGDLCDLLSSQKYDAELFKAAMRVFQVDTHPLGNRQEIDRNALSWCHMLTLAHFGVYLIDFFQEISDNCQWEEQRLFFVKLIKEWNSSSVRHRYLYEPGDLSTTNYLDSYPGSLAPRGMVLSLSVRAAGVFHMERGFSRVTKFVSFNRRGLRFRRRHHTKAIHSWGLRIRGSDRTWEVRMHDDLHTVYDEVKGYLKKRLV